MSSPVAPSSRTSRNNKEKPKRPLSAYNLFFQDERIKLLDSLPAPKCKKTKKSHGKIGFAGLARTLAEKWKAAPESTKAIYEELAAKEKRQYALDMVKWAQQQEEEPVQEKPNHDPKPPRFTEAVVPPQEPQATQWVPRAETSVATHDKRNTYRRENNSGSGMPKADSFCWAPEPLQTGFPLPSQQAMPTMTTSPPKSESRAMAKRHENFGDLNACAPATMKIGMPNQQQQSMMEPSLNNPSTQLLGTFLQQPGMADFVSQMYTLLSQSVPQQGQASLKNFASMQSLLAQKMNVQENQTQQDLSPYPFEPEGQPSVPCVSDSLLGNIEPFERETQHFLDDESVFEDVFPL